MPRETLSKVRLNATRQGPLTMSHVLCSRNRATQLQTALTKFDVAAFRRNSVELILVDSASTDDTFHIMEDFSRAALDVVKTCRVDRPGLGYARNAGVALAKGDLLVFTDDDCYIEGDFHRLLLKYLNPAHHHYGMGQVLLWDQSDDPRVANRRIPKFRLIAPGSVLPAGLIQGANMFVLRDVFSKVGAFRDDMGAGTPFPCEDIEFATRCSLAGYTGVLLPEVRVFHHHGKKAGSPEAEATLHGYDFGRGAYYASLITQGVTKAWEVWMRQSRVGASNQENLLRLEREFKGAAEYIRHQLESSKKPPG